MKNRVLGPAGFLFGVSFLVNCTIAGLIAWFFPDALGGSAVFTFLIVLVFLEVVPTLFALKSALVSAVFLYLQRNKTRELLLIQMKNADLPLDSDLPYFDGDAYLIQVASGNDYTAEQRICATEILVSLNMLRQHRAVQAIAFNAALEGAIRERYKSARSDT